MKKINLFLINILIISLAFSCQKKKKVKKENIETESIRNNYKSLFLSFSPEMTDLEFENEIKEKTWDKTLDLGKFIIELNSKKYKFELQKGEKSVNLFYGESKIISKEFLSVKKSKEILRKQEILNNSLIQLFRNKPEYTESEMPKLKENKKELFLFRNKEKSVLLTFMKSGNIIRSPKEQAEYYNKLRRENPNSLAGIGQFMEKEKTEHYLNYIWISYYPNQEIDKQINLTKKIINKRKKEKTEKLKKLETEKEIKKRKIIENKNLL